MELQQAFTDDIAALKTLQLKIIPAKRYYGALFSRLAKFYGIFLSIQLIACFWGLYLGAWDNDDGFSPERIRIAKMFLGVIFSSGIFSLFMLGKIRTYVLFKYQFKAHLKTGAYLEKKFIQAAQFFFALFASFSLVFLEIFNQDLSFFAGILSFLASAGVMSYLIEMEASRLGFTLLVQTVLARLQKQGSV